MQSPERLVGVHSWRGFCALPEGGSELSRCRLQNLEARCRIFTSWNRSGPFAAMAMAFGVPKVVKHLGGWGPD
jgi:hypothetical protein